MGPRRRKKLETVASRTVSVPPDEVAAVIRDGESWSSWQPEIVEAEGPRRLEAGDSVVGRARMMGFDVDGRATIDEASSERMSEDVIVGVRMRIVFELEPRDGDTVVTHRLESDLPAGPWGSVVSFFLKRRLVRMQRDALEGLRKEVEGR